MSETDTQLLCFSIWGSKPRDCKYDKKYGQTQNAKESEGNPGLEILFGLEITCNWWKFHRENLEFIKLLLNFSMKFECFIFPKTPFPSDSRELNLFTSR